MVNACRVQIVILVGIICNEALRSALSGDYYDNPIALITPGLVAVLVCAWLCTLVLLVRDNAARRPIPRWCKVTQGVVGCGIFLFVLAMARFVFL